MLSYAGGPIPDSVINVFLRKKIKNMNNSSLTNDGLVKTSRASAPCNAVSTDSLDKYITFP